MELAERVGSRAIFLPEPASIEETGLDQGFIIDLCLKTIYALGRPSARVICDRMCLPFTVLEGVLEFLRRQEYLDVVGSSGLTEQDYQYSLTGKGVVRTQEAQEKNLYVGPAPVPFDLYEAVVARQSIGNLDPTPEKMARALDRLVLHPETVSQIGTALGSGRSIFLYGPPGNGKSAVAERIVSLLGDEMLIPYAIEVSGQIIRIHDPRVHRPWLADAMGASDGRDYLSSITQRREGRDQRWALSHRPLIIGGGELAMSDLELRYSTVSRFYIAPMQLKANNGVLVVDDFGRQLMRPEEMLNRWMVPMDRQIDHLTFQTGETITVPFDELLVFATNLKPSQLGDEAFFRRIRHKILIPDPTEVEFRAIMQLVAGSTGITYNEDAADHLIETHYKAAGRPFRGVHPRDIFALINDMSKYERREPLFTSEAVDRACRSYFVED